MWKTISFNVVAHPENLSRKVMQKNIYLKQGESCLRPLTAGIALQQTPMTLSTGTSGYRKYNEWMDTFAGIQKEAFLFSKPSQNNQSQSPVYAGIFFMAAVPGLAATLLSSLDDMS